MDKHEINQIVDELEKRGYAPKQYPPPPQQHYGGGGSGLIFLFIIGIIAFGAWYIFSQPSTPIQGSTPVLIQATREYTITESETVILATSAPLAYPTNTAIPATPLPEVVPVVTIANPMLQATLAGEWPRPITFEQYDMCVQNPNVNPVCEDYLK